MIFYNRLHFIEMVVKMKKTGSIQERFHFINDRSRFFSLASSTANSIACKEPFLGKVLLGFFTAFFVACFFTLSAAIVKYLYKYKKKTCLYLLILKHHHLPTISFPKFASQQCIFCYE